MAHPDHIKAQALVELMTGESPRHVAKMLGLPLTTVKRWRNVDMKQWFREIFGPDVKQSIRLKLKERLQG
jgi:hypothetical protein